MQVQTPRVTPFYGSRKKKKEKRKSSGLFTFINRKHTLESCYYPAWSPQVHWDVCFHSAYVTTLLPSIPSQYSQTMKKTGCLCCPLTLHLKVKMLEFTFCIFARKILNPETNNLQAYIG